MSSSATKIDAYIDDCMLSDEKLEEKNLKYPHGTTLRNARNELYSRIIAVVPKECSLGGYAKNKSNCIFFCIKKSDIAKYSDEILQLASRQVKNEYNHIMECNELCKWCGSVSFESPMHTYRTISGSVAGSCECTTCRTFKLPILEKVLRIKESQGIMAAKKFEFAQL